MRTEQDESIPKFCPYCAGKIEVTSQPNVAGEMVHTVWCPSCKKGTTVWDIEGDFCHSCGQAYSDADMETIELDEHGHPICEACGNVMEQIQFEVDQ